MSAVRYCCNRSIAVRTFGYVGRLIKFGVHALACRFVRLVSSLQAVGPRGHAEARTPNGHTLKRGHRTHVNLAGDGGGDERRPVFLQPLNRRADFRYQGVQFGGFCADVIGDAFLFI